MIIDKELLFSEKQAITKSEASANVIDLGAGGDAVGQELVVHCIASTGFAGATAVSVAIETADAPTGATWHKLATGPQKTEAADLAAGKELCGIRMPPGAKRYVRLYYTVAGSISAGAVTAYASKDL